MKKQLFLFLAVCLSLPIVAQNKTFKVGNETFEMVFVEKGTFKMGLPIKYDENELGDDMRPHTVTVSSFYIGKFEVTQALWTAVMGKNDDPSFHSGGKLPVEDVTWDDCQDFIKALNKITGEKFKLPTEAQWEFAARGGNKSKGYKYAGSNEQSKVCKAPVRSGSNNTYEVGKYLPNELGIYDMSGNVAEWCSDWYDLQYYAKSPKNDPQGPSEPDNRKRRSVCGGKATYIPPLGMRDYHDSENSDIYIGFRLVL